MYWHSDLPLRSTNRDWAGTFSLSPWNSACSDPGQWTEHGGGVEGWPGQSLFWSCSQCRRLRLMTRSIYSLRDLWWGSPRPGRNSGGHRVLCKRHCTGRRRSRCCPQLGYGNWWYNQWQNSTPERGLKREWMASLSGWTGSKTFQLFGTLSQKGKSTDKLWHFSLWKDIV